MPPITTFTTTALILYFSVTTIDWPQILVKGKQAAFKSAECAKVGEPAEVTQTGVLGTEEAKVSLEPVPQEVLLDGEDADIHETQDGWFVGRAEVIEQDADEQLDGAAKDVESDKKADTGGEEKEEEIDESIVDLELLEYLTEAMQVNIYLGPNEFTKHKTSSQARLLSKRQQPSIHSHAPAGTSTSYQKSPKAALALIATYAPHAHNYEACKGSPNTMRFPLCSLHAGTPCDRWRPLKTRRRSPWQLH